MIARMGMGCKEGWLKTPFDGLKTAESDPFILWKTKRKHLYLIFS